MKCPKCQFENPEGKKFCGDCPNPEISFTISNPDTVYQKRRVELAKQLFQLMEIPRDDMEKGMQWLERAFVSSMHP